jgi:hypothetical protein
MLLSSAMSSLEVTSPISSSVDEAELNNEDLFPYQNWEDLYGDLGNMVIDLVDECYEHLGELYEGTYCGRRVSQEVALGLTSGYQEEVQALQSLDINDKEAVLRVMRMHQKRKNAANDFIIARTGEAVSASPIG